MTRYWLAAIAASIAVLTGCETDAPVLLVATDGVSNPRTDGAVAPDALVWQSDYRLAKKDTRPWLWDTRSQHDIQLPAVDTEMIDASSDCSDASQKDDADASPIAPPDSGPLPPDSALLPPVDMQKAPDLLCPQAGTPCSDGAWCTMNDAIDPETCACKGQPYTCYNPLPCLVQRCDGIGGCYYDGKKSLQLYNGCYIDGKCIPAGTHHPGNDCQMCTPGMSEYSWSFYSSPYQEGEACSAGVSCDAGWACKPPSGALGECRCKCKPAVAGACNDLQHKVCRQLISSTYVCD